MFKKKNVNCLEKITIIEKNDHAIKIKNKKLNIKQKILSKGGEKNNSEFFPSEN
jgi:hypothetical protein